MNQGGVIKYVLAIAVVLALVFLSQQTQYRQIGKNLFEKVESWVSPAAQKAYNWASENVFSKIGQNVQSGGEAIKNAAEEQKNNLMQGVWEKIKNYFAEKFSNATGTKVK